MTRTIKINGEIIREKCVINEAPEGFQIIASFFGKISEVKKLAKRYANRNVTFRYFTTLPLKGNKVIHILRVLKEIKETK